MKKLKQCDVASYHSLLSLRLQSFFSFLSKGGSVLVRSGDVAPPLFVRAHIRTEELGASLPD